MSGQKILVIDDEASIRNLLDSELKRRGYETVLVGDGAAALAKIKEEKFSLAISDVQMPKMTGLQLLEAGRDIDPDLEFIMTTGYATVQIAVDAMKKGAYHFLEKPFNIDEMAVLVDKAIEKNEMKRLLDMYETSRGIFSTVKLDTLLPQVTNWTKRILKADDVSVMLVDGAGELAMAALSESGEDKRSQARVEIGSAIAGKVAETRQPALLNGPPYTDPRFKGIEPDPRIKASIVYPLILNDRVLGVLNINRTTWSEPFSKADLKLAGVFSAQVSQGVFNAQLYLKLEEKIQELKTAQNQLVQSEKLASIGQLAAGVAHELNNPLTGILGFAQILLQGKDLTGQQREDVEAIHVQSQRCRAIIQNLLQFARKKESKMEPTVLVPLIKSTLQLAKYDLQTSGVELVQDFPDTLPPVWADASQLQQVFLNLLTNARHAMEGKKKGAKLTVRAVHERDHVLVQFSDNGCGIAKENLKKIFDPFFTTKAVGRGTGLGLSITYGIIEQHNGSISVESEEGKGTTFYIKLPVLEKKA